VSATLMAKKRPGKKTPEPERRRTVLTIKGTEEWRGWMERLAEFLRTPTSTIVDHALVRYAKEMGFKEEAPPR
jgi:hypothetical protein